ncbi:hypothetical protein [Xenorhabdus innexi]|uniref:Alpha/beta hydrolase n=1 Tax=Xenorhabdus innexi TaxID=290109 RepID=A0A1N6MR23_9GAMM|nr:hypothetical protein [Xenorhabdus innexi]PHM27010.1 alpha/beta hydrolase [Xenorhabdus innexi]SIP71301.1 conserved hypothetical protein [Xenorhabdus innexi]
MGGYTGLAVSGGVPVATPDQAHNQSVEKISVTYDSRICSLILMAPACGWFNGEDSLNSFSIPILLLTAEKDHLSDILCTSILENLSNVQHKMVENAGHHSFQSPFPPYMSHIDFTPSQDPIGFDRLQYQSVLCTEIKEFISRIYN